MDVLDDDDSITDTIEYMINKMATQGDVMSRSPHTLADMYIIKNNKFIGPKFDIRTLRKPYYISLKNRVFNV